MLQDYSQIMIPIDGSKNSKLAFNKSIEVAKHNDADLHIVHVIDTRSFTNLANFDSSMLDDVTSRVKDSLEKYLKKAQDAGIKNVDYTIEYGAPKSIISRDLVDRFDTDLIIIGANGQSAAERLLIGSVASYVTRVAECDVLIVKSDLDNKVEK
ncbi:MULTISPECIES: universal stress protein [Apilactobacillus]|uniref:Universal stress protein n=2 Tax=Apilactobacillus kunkeei TaxID=148814 RepID=A0A0N0CTZ1_9LACO|nr:universal stress protein [Apilactobacillus kunkeei]KOY70107.1 Universal stress family protein [Apilactobacillus kunkeei]KOY73286.1 Universal stress family protein [Apilactobacillus kunkeei DSM 12361 = ATCC 700308]KOY79341.1 Universal stress family protein [Apilactobacillus kunkeei]KPN83216.1 Universal stress family protein [Apilactobacillus kunkeei]KRK25215.1 universal stress family protein [Apilactobacillus kunkeei DSM 12361 = ATCC 700308]